ncbi:MAG: hypothetical protein FJX46_03145 [Alphaproteobacteria bacterium]|nr:hypothetical protein [Alphaproteobacteria bacterium]
MTRFGFLLVGAAALAAPAFAAEPTPGDLAWRDWGARAMREVAMPALTRGLTAEERRAFSVIRFANLPSAEVLPSGARRGEDGRPAVEFSAGYYRALSTQAEAMALAARAPDRRSALASLKDYPDSHARGLREGAAPDRLRFHVVLGLPANVWSPIERDQDFVRARQGLALDALTFLAAREVAHVMLGQLRPDGKAPVTDRDSLAKAEARATSHLLRAEMDPTAALSALGMARVFEALALGAEYRAAAAICRLSAAVTNGVKDAKAEHNLEPSDAAWSEQTTALREAYRCR